MSLNLCHVFKSSSKSLSFSDLCDLNKLKTQSENDGNQSEALLATATATAAGSFVKTEIYEFWRILIEVKNLNN